MFLVAAATVPLAVLIAYGVLRLVIVASSGTLPRAHEVHLSWETVLATLVMSLTASAAASLPATLGMMRQTGRGSLAETVTDRGRSRREGAAMAVQAGLVVALCFHAVSLSWSLAQLLNSAVGFERTDLVTARVVLPPDESRDPAVRAGMLESLSRTLSARGLAAATMNTLPLSGYDRLGSLREDPDRRPYTMVGIRLVSSSYFEVFGVTPLAGRLLTVDDAGSNRVLVNENLARGMFGSAEAAVNERIVLGAVWDPDSEIVGVVRSVRHWSLLREPQPEVYVLFLSAGRMDAAAAEVFFVATPGGRGIQSVLRDVLREEVPEAQVAEITHFEDLLWAAASTRPLMALSTSVLAAVSFLLLSAGLHGMMERSLASRRHEFAVRLALGATPRHIVNLGIRLAAGVYVGGIGVGLILAYVLTQAIRIAVPHEPGLPSPPMPLVAVAAGALVAVGVAMVSLRSTIRVARTDPAGVLRVV